MSADRLVFEWRRVRQMPLHVLASKGALKVVSVLVGLLLLPVTVLLHFVGYRQVTVFTDRIGHLALEPDCLIKEQALGNLPQRKWILLAPPGRVANLHLLGYWQPHFHIVHSQVLCFVIGSMSRWGLMRHDVGHYVRAIGHAQAAYRVYAQWGLRPPLLRLVPDDEAWADDMLEQLGLPPDAWFVCMHARESGFSPVDEALHSHRNGSVENLLPAAQEVVRRGGWVIRIGDASMAPMPAMPQLIDYARHGMKSARMDVVLCARARFILGNSSGIALVGSLFGTPCALANMVPVSALGVSPRDISIPKLHWSMSMQRYLHFPELFASPLSRAQYSRLFDEAGVVPMENSADDIRDLAGEMMDRLESPETTRNDGNNLNRTFMSLFDENHYARDAMTTIGTRFLVRHRQLLDPVREATQHDEPAHSSPSVNSVL
jgi:putative glycosyltransferase (TIGR04372 family)